MEVQAVEEILDGAAAGQLGLFMGQVAVMIHTGSRGLGHQIATDHIRAILHVMPKYGISLPDRELAGVPFETPEGQAYWHAMACGANFAWANRQLITWEVRQAFADVLGEDQGSLEVVYDVAHNIGKLEPHGIDGREARVLVHEALRQRIEVTAPSGIHIRLRYVRMAVGCLSLECLPAQIAA